MGNAPTIMGSWNGLTIGSLHKGNNATYQFDDNTPLSIFIYFLTYNTTFGELLKFPERIRPSPLKLLKNHLILSVVTVFYKLDADRKGVFTRLVCIFFLNFRIWF